MAPTHPMQDVSRKDNDVSAVARDPKPRITFIQQFFSYFQLLFYANPTWIDLTLLFTGTLCAAASGAPLPLMGVLFGQLLDDLNAATCKAQQQSAVDTGAIQPAVDAKVLKLVYIGIANFVLIYIHVLSWSLFSRRLENRLRDRYFQSLLRQDASFFDTRQAGELSTRLNADIQAVQSGTSEKVGICIASISFFLTAYVVGFVKDPKLTGILISIIPTFLLMAVVGSTYTQRFSKTVSDSIASASSVAQETFSHISVVQAFSAGPRLEAKFEARAMTAQEAGIKKSFVVGVQAGLLLFVAYATNALAYWQGSKQVASAVDDGGDGTTVGDIYTVVFLLVDACMGLGSIAPLLPLLGAAAASFQKLREDIEKTSAIDPYSDAGEKLPISIPGSLRFETVSFAYPSRPERQVLRNISFDCPAGRYTALVGLSGSGKSTIAGLATRLYDPNDGAVLLDGHDLRGLNVKNLRSFMSLVQQEPSLLDRSILENIASGLLNSPKTEHRRFESILLSPALSEIATMIREGSSMDMVLQSFDQDTADLVTLVRQVASLADASKFIEGLENGYGTVVGTGGKLVSGGQRQRIALARALIRDPKILILDEATASLDSASELRIQTAVESIAKDRTVIAIAHRLSTIRNADNIIVMNNGTILEQGTHLKLMARDGAYAGMVRLQNIKADEQGDAVSLSSTAKGDSYEAFTEKVSFIDGRDDKDECEPAAKQAPRVEAMVEGVPADAVLVTNKSFGYIVRSIGPMIRPHLHWLIVAAVGSLIVGCASSAFGLIFGHTIGIISPCNPTSSILWGGMFYGGMFFMLAVVEFFANTANWSGFGFVAEKLLYKIRVLSFRSLYEKGLDWQSGGRTTTSLLSVITADTAAVGGFSGSIIGTMISVTANFIIAIIMCHIIAWKIAIVCLVTMPILFGSGIMQFRELVRFERKHAGAFACAIGITVEAVNSFRTIASLSIEPEIMGSFRRALKLPRSEMIFASTYANLWLAIANSVANLVYAFAYWWGSTRIARGEYTQTQFFIVLMAMLVSAQLWGQMFSLAPEVTRAKAAASRIFSLLDLDSEGDLGPEQSDGLKTSTNGRDIEAAVGATPVPHCKKGGATIRFRNVSFAYPARPQVLALNGISFTVLAGQLCGLVGPSGAGKSTIMALMHRLYSTSSGAVEIDGVDINSRDSTEFRDEIAVVPQDCALFEGTIQFNVGLGARPNHNPSTAEIEEACRLANIHDTIVALPNGYETECGPNGSRLSGGQRQRLAIARALVRKPRLLLLDESTSALDAESESALQDGLERAAKGITVIAITHRLRTVRRADVIFVIEEGKIVAKGRHEELVERSESYRVNALQQML